MSKLSFLLGSTFLIYLSTLIVNSMPQFENQSNIFDRTYPDGPPENTGFFEGIFNTFGDMLEFLAVFFDMLTFRVDGLPAAFSIIFILLTIGILYILVTLIRGGG